MNQKFSLRLSMLPCQSLPIIWIIPIHIAKITSFQRGSNSSKKQYRTIENPLQRGQAVSDDSYRNVQEPLFKTRKMVAELLIRPLNLQSLEQSFTIIRQYTILDVFCWYLSGCCSAYDTCFVSLVVCLTGSWGTFLCICPYCPLEIKVRSRRTRLITCIQEENN